MSDFDALQKALQELHDLASSSGRFVHVTPIEQIPIPPTLGKEFFGFLAHYVDDHGKMRFVSIKAEVY